MPKYASYKVTNDSEELLHRHKNKESALRFLRGSKRLREKRKYVFSGASIKIFILNDIGQKIGEVSSTGHETVISMRREE